MKNKEHGMLRKVAKEMWIKTSFWMPENAEEELKNEVAAPEEKAKKPRMVCPYNRLRTGNEPTDGQTDQTHKLKFKDLITLKLFEDDSRNEFMCEVCNKKLGHQKSIALRKCGHVMCLSCCNQFVFMQKKGKASKKMGKGQCPSCSVEIRDPVKGVINLQESGSAFASHSKVEATIYKPAFKS